MTREGRAAPWPERGARAVLAAAAALASFVVGMPVAVAAFLDGASAQGTFATATLAAPTGLTSQNCTGLITGSVNLSWTATTSTWADGYVVIWSGTNGSSGTQTVLDSNPADGVVSPTSTTVSGLAKLATYTFVVRAFESVNWRSPASNQVSEGCGLL